MPSPKDTPPVPVRWEQGRSLTAESTARPKDTPPVPVRWEQDNDHPGFCPPTATADTDTFAETHPPPLSPAAGPKPTHLSHAQLERLAQAQGYLRRTVDMMPRGTTLRWDGRHWLYIPDTSTHELAYQQGWQAGYAEGYDPCAKDWGATESFGDAPQGGFCRVQTVTEYLLPHCGCIGTCERGLPGTPQPAMHQQNRP